MGWVRSLNTARAQSPAAACSLALAEILGSANPGLPSWAILFRPYGPWCNPRPLISVFPGALGISAGLVFIRAHPLALGSRCSLALAEYWGQPTPGLRPGLLSFGPFDFAQGRLYGPLRPRWFWF